MKTQLIGVIRSAAAVIMGVALFASVCYGQATLDQENNPSVWIGGALNIEPAGKVSQDFWPSFPCLVAIDVGLAADHNKPKCGDEVTLKLLPAPGSPQPYATVSASIPPGFEGFWRFYLPQMGQGGLTVSVNRPITFQLENKSGCIQWKYNLNNPYPKGRAWLGANPFGNNDFFFKTYGMNACIPQSHWLDIYEEEDQRSVVFPASTPFGGLDIYPGSMASQTFVPTYPCLMEVDVWLMPTTGTVTPNTADELTLKILDSWRIYSSVTASTQMGAGYQAFIPPRRIPVPVGMPLTIQLEGKKGYFNWKYSAGNPYPQGQAYYRGKPLQDNDFWFRTQGSGMGSCQPPPSTTVPTPPPSINITGVTPKVQQKGGTITITGSNFNSDCQSNVITIGGVATKPTGCTSTSLTAQVPQQARYGHGNVLVNGYSNNSSDLTVARVFGDFVEITNDIVGQRSTRTCSTGAVRLDVCPPNCPGYASGAYVASFKNAYPNTSIGSPITFFKDNPKVSNLGGAGFSLCSVGIVLNAYANNPNGLMEFQFLDLDTGKIFGSPVGQPGRGYGLNLEVDVKNPPTTYNPRIFRSPDGTIIMVIAGAGQGVANLQAGFIDKFGPLGSGAFGAIYNLQISGNIAATVTSNNQISLTVGSTTYPPFDIR
ncbi:MAG: IPT/TIG domain-containing protein [Syntrophales bacterium LBB04]|nr:IPT/TIG domain-containing protein [Syntrophales bacterium LBB04]